MWYPAEVHSHILKLGIVPLLMHELCTTWPNTFSSSRSMWRVYQACYFGQEVCAGQGDKWEPKAELPGQGL